MTYMKFKVQNLNERNAEKYQIDKLMFSGEDAEPFLQSSTLLGLSSDKIGNFLNTCEKPVFEEIDWRTLQNVFDYILKGETIVEAHRAAKFIRFCEVWQVRNVNERRIISGIHHFFPQFSREMDLEKLFLYLSKTSHCTFYMEDCIQAPFKEVIPTPEVNWNNPCELRRFNKLAYCYYHSEETITKEEDEGLDLVKSLVSELVENSSKE